MKNSSASTCDPPPVSPDDSGEDRDVCVAVGTANAEEREHKCGEQIGNDTRKKKKNQLARPAEQ